VHIQATSTPAKSKARKPPRSCLRELAQGKHADWLGRWSFLITPIFNADGNEKVLR
jgi:hypothetical protein